MKLETMGEFIWFIILLSISGFLFTGIIGILGQIIFWIIYSLPGS